jgi:hypothetical protein
MKNYFSQLAKRTGLDVSSGHASATIGSPLHLNSNQPSKPQHQPFRVEEVEIVAPPQPPHASPETDSRREREAFNNEQEKESSPASKRLKDNAQELANQYADEEKRRSLESSEPLLETSVVKTVEPQLPFERVNLTSDKAQSRNIDDKSKGSESDGKLDHISVDKDSDSSGLTVFNQTTFVEPSKQNADKRFTKTEENNSASRALVKEEEGPQYFQKTAELLETNFADKEEVQRVFLGEVREWVASPPPSAREEEAFVSQKEKNTSFDANEQIELRTTSLERDEKVAVPTLVERVAERSLSNEESIEQNFNLSIENISIVIEQPQAAKQISSQPSLTNKPQTQTREFSRLSRHYIR